jgi:hypothetical protein
MKKLIILTFAIGLLSSCVDEYTAKDRNGAPILIRDNHGIIQDAFSLGLDSIYVRKFDNDDHYVPLRFMGSDETSLNSDTLANGKKIWWYTSYRVIHTSNIVKR